MSRFAPIAVFGCILMSSTAWSQNGGEDQVKQSVAFAVHRPVLLTDLPSSTFDRKITVAPLLQNQERKAVSFKTLRLDEDLSAFVKTEHISEQFHVDASLLITVTD